MDMSFFDFRPSPQTDDETEVSDIMLGGEKIGILKAYKATEEEAKTIKSKLKRKVKPGEVFSLKVILKRDLGSDGLLSLKSKVDERFPSLPGRKYFLLEKQGETTPLRI